MSFEFRKSFIDFYELLGVAEDAPSSVIEQALDQYRTSLEAQLGNPLTATAARDALNEIVPDIEYRLLSSPEMRTEYDRQLADFRHKPSGTYEPEDDEGLDESLRIPFLFDPYNDFDTEIPAFTLRDIAWKLDQEWPRTYQWIADTSSATHSFVSYLTLVANRRRLTAKIEAIIKAVWRPDEMRMPVNEGIERCINILDPNSERPLAGIQNLTFDGYVLDAGSYIPDLPAHTELILAHEGTRGCAFGTIESRTAWLTFGQGQSSIHFALMPRGTNPSIGPSQVKIPLAFTVQNLPHNADFSASLILHMENQARSMEIPFQVLIHVLPQPPRVNFIPVSDSPFLSDSNLLADTSPEPHRGNDTYRGVPAQLQPQAAPPPVLLWAAITRRGQPASARAQAINTGDETLVPLVGRIDSNGTSVQPREFHHNDVITITVDTSNKPYGQPYNVFLDIDYITPDSWGPKQICVQGETLPTIRQSMLREKSFGERAGVGGIGSIIGLLVFGFLALLTHAGPFWLVLAFLMIPALFTIATQTITSRIIAHRQRAGDKEVYMERLNLQYFRGIPIACGLAIALLCTLLPDPSSSFFVGGLIGLILGFALGFVLDKAQPAKMHLLEQEEKRTLPPLQMQ